MKHYPLKAFRMLGSVMLYGGLTAGIVCSAFHLTVYSLICGLIAILSIPLTMLLYRCPSCHKPLDPRIRDLDTCPNCGQPLGGSHKQ